MREETLLEVRNLTVSFERKGKAVSVVREVDYHLQRREIVGIIGESGSGKTVSTLSILGLAGKGSRIESGQAFFQGEDLLTLGEKKLRRIRGRKIATIFQTPQNALNPHMKIGRQFEEVAALHGIQAGWADIREILLEVGIEKPDTFRHMHAAQLSGGMCQRAAIAMGILAKPSVLIADEPTSSIDASLRRKILVLLKKVSVDYGMSILLITHDFDVARFLCDRIVVMYGGRVMEEGTVGQIFERPRHPYTRELIRCVESLRRMDRRLHTLGGDPPDPESAGNLCPFFERCPERLPVCGREVPKLEAEGHRALRCFNPIGGEGV